MHRIDVDQIQAGVFAAISELIIVALAVTDPVAKGRRPKVEGGFRIRHRTHLRLVAALAPGQQLVAGLVIPGINRIDD